MLEQCAEMLHRELPALVDATLKRVDDSLYEFADKAESDRSYATYFEAQRYLRHQRASLKRRFLRNLTETVALFQDGVQGFERTPERGFDADYLEILGDRDLEESLVLTNMISKAEARYLRPLRDLTHHFAQLLGRPGLRQCDVPVSPTAIANAFAAALRSVEELDISTVLVVHKIFDQQVMDHLEGVYGGCLDFARRQGLVLQSRKHEIVKSADEARPDTRRPAPASASAPSEAFPPGVGSIGDAVRAGARNGAGPEAASPADRAEAAASAGAGGTSVFEALQGLLAAARQSCAGGHARETLATQDLLALLSQVQPETARRAAHQTLTPSALRDTVDDRLRASMDPARPARLAPNDKDTMDLVFLLFEELLAGGDMPDAIKVLVSRLQIPYVKAALVDRRFFDDIDHPARRLLNRIAEASIGWSEGDRDIDAGLYARLDHLVQRVVTESQTDPELFETLDQELAESVSRQQGRAASAQERVVRQAVARSARQTARREARSRIAARVPEPDRLQPVVRTILQEGWVEAMVQAYADGGKQGRPWRTGERILDDLLWSVMPKPDPAERRVLLQRIPELLRDLRSCLGTVIADQQLLARWLKELQTVHIAALRGQHDAGITIAAPPAPQADVGTDANAVPGQDADALPIGCWLGVAWEDGRIQRFKLAWRGETGDPVLFVDRLGRKGFELRQPELEAMLRQDLASVIGTGDRPLVDRAMDAVRDTLSRS